MELTIEQIGNKWVVKYSTSSWSFDSEEKARKFFDNFFN